MSDEILTEVSPIEAAIGRVIELFMGVGADPDNAATGAAADQALHDLDDVMIAAASGTETA